MKKSKNEKLEVYSVIGFSIMMWFVSIILIFLGVSLLKGNYSSVHGKVLDTERIRKANIIDRNRSLYFRNNCGYITA